MFHVSFDEKVGEEIVIGSNINIKVTAILGVKVRIAISAPKEVVVDRKEVHQKRKNLISDKPVLTPASISNAGDLSLIGRETGPRF